MLVWPPAIPMPFLYQFNFFRDQYSHHLLQAAFPISSANWIPGLISCPQSECMVLVKTIKHERQTAQAAKKQGVPKSNSSLPLSKSATLGQLLTSLSPSVFICQMGRVTMASLVFVAIKGRDKIHVVHALGELTCSETQDDHTWTKRKQIKALCTIRGVLKQEALWRAGGILDS